MRNRLKVTGFFAGLLAIMVPLFWASGQDAAGSAERETNPLISLLKTPIDFYGIVLDQYGKPVPSAEINASVADNMISGSLLNTKSDAMGRFTLKTRGAGLHIEVKKGGYRRTEPESEISPSSQGFDYGVDVGRGIHRPDPSAPIVFHLRKAVNPVPLERLSANPKVPRDGTSIAVSLEKTSKVSIQISCRTIEDNPIPNGPYKWRCEVAIQGGGIQEVADEQSFLAPDKDYSASALIDMRKTLDRNLWSSRVTKNYWLRFTDGSFGRIQFGMFARGEHFAVIEGFRNPSPGDRNLEPLLPANR